MSLRERYINGCLKNRMKKNRQSAFLWNMMGGFCNSITSFLLLLFVTRALGNSEGGIFSFAFATAQLMLTIGKYGVRAYQATDVHNNNSFADYIVSRSLTCFLMMVASVLYVLWMGYDERKGAIILFACMIKLADAVEDVFHGELQRENELALAGKLLTARNLITIASFLVVLIFSRDLFTTCLLTAVISLFASVLINVMSTLKFCKIKGRASYKCVKQVTIACLPLFLGSFLSLCIYNMPKVAIDGQLASEYQTYYSILFMPAFVINLFSEFVFKPLLTDLAYLWNENRKADFVKVVWKLLALILGLTLSAVTAAYVLGIPILSFIYKVNLASYRMELLLLMCGGGFGAAVYLLNNVLTSMRKQGLILLGYAMATILIGVITPGLVSSYRIYGAALSYLISISMLFLFFFTVLFTLVFNNKRRNAGDENESSDNYSGI